MAEESRNAFIAAGCTRTQAREVIFITALKTISHYTHHLAETPLDAAFAEQKWTRQN